MNSLILGGAGLMLVGLLGFAVPYITTQQTHEVAHIGALKIDATEEHTVAIPQILAGGAAGLGIILFGLGFSRRV